MWSDSNADTWYSTADWCIEVSAWSFLPRKTQFYLIFLCQHIPCSGFLYFLRCSLNCITICYRLAWIYQKISVKCTEAFTMGCFVGCCSLTGIRFSLGSLYTILPTPRCYEVQTTNVLRWTHRRRRALAFALNSVVFVGSPWRLSSQPCNLEIL
jgi:hypothetical protein